MTPCGGSAGCWAIRGSNPSSQEIFLFRKPYEPALGPTQPPIQRVLGVFFLPESKAAWAWSLQLTSDLLPRLRMNGAISLLSYAFMAWSQTFPLCSPFLLVSDYQIVNETSGAAVFSRPQETAVNFEGTWKFNTLSHPRYLICRGGGFISCRAHGCPQSKDATVYM